jgi:hypothetical protein
MPTATFWNLATTEPKRQFRFILEMGEMGQAASFACKAVSKPSVSLDSTQHQFLNHTFNYPNRAVWQPISVTLVDMVSPDMGASILGILRESGYTWPTDINMASTNIIKSQAASAFGKVKISQLGKPFGTNLNVNVQDWTNDIVDQWVLFNAYMGGTVDFGGELSYGSDDLVEVKFDLIYDYAYMTYAGGKHNGWKGQAADGIAPKFKSPLDTKKT